MKTNTLRKAITYLLLVAACGLSSQSLHPGQIILKPGQGVADARRGIEVIFIEVVQDSRCPADARCIWAGQVQVLLDVRQGTESFQPTLTLGDLSDGSVNAIAVGGFRITLTQVSPYPQTTQTIDPSTYEITLDIQSK